MATFGKAHIKSSSTLTMEASLVNSNLASVSSNVLTMIKSGTYKILATVWGYNIGPSVKYSINGGTKTGVSSTSSNVKETEITLSSGDTIGFYLYSGSTNGEMGGAATLVNIS